MHNDQRGEPSLSARGKPPPSLETRTGSEFQRRSLISPISVSVSKAGASSVVTLPAGKPTLEERLFDATAKAKIWTSQVAMHLDKDARDRFFRQIDNLHDLNEWIGEDSPINLESYKAFIRSVLFLKINTKPALALMPGGNLLAIWQDQKGKVSIEFMPGGRVRWFAAREIDGEMERATGTANLTRTRAVLAPYDGDRWFDAS